MKIRKTRNEDEVQSIIEEVINDEDGTQKLTEEISQNIIDLYYFILLEESKLDDITISKCSFYVDLKLNWIHFNFEINAEGPTQDILSLIHRSKRIFQQVYESTQKIPWHFSEFKGHINIKDDQKDETIDFIACCPLDVNTHSEHKKPLIDLEELNRTKVIFVEFNDENNSVLQIKVKPDKLTDIEKTRIH